MDLIKLNIAICEAKRFIMKATDAEKVIKKTQFFSASKETAACKRASLDLTRALAEMRKP